MCCFQDLTLPCFVLLQISLLVLEEIVFLHCKSFIFSPSCYWHALYLFAEYGEYIHTHYGLWNKILSVLILVCFWYPNHCCFTVKGLYVYTTISWSYKRTFHKMCVNWTWCWLGVGLYTELVRIRTAKSKC